MLTSLTSLVRTLTDFALIPAIWKIVRIHVLPEIETLPSGDVLAQALGKLVFELEVLFYRVQPLHPGTAGDSSRTYAESHPANAGPAFFEHRDLIIRYTVDESPWKGPFVEAAKHVVSRFLLQITILTTTKEVIDQGRIVRLSLRYGGRFCAKKGYGRPG